MKEFGSESLSEREQENGNVGVNAGKDAPCREISDAERFCALVETANELSVVLLAMEGANERLAKVLGCEDEEGSFLVNFYFGAEDIVRRSQERIARLSLQ